MLSLLDIVGVTSTGMTFSATFTYLEGEYLNNVVWALEQFWGIFLIRDALLEVIVTDKDVALMNAMKSVFPESTNLLCLFHIDKNVKTKCKTKKCMEYCHGSPGEFGGLSYWARLPWVPYEVWNCLLTMANVC